MNESKRFNSNAIERFLRYLFALCVVCASVFYRPAVARAGEPDLTAEAAILVEASTGRILYEKNADRLMYPASMTKLMTCLLALENGRLSDSVTISHNAAQTPYTYLDEGDTLSLEMLLTELMLESDNGGSVAVAEYIDGDEETFAARMTDRAYAVGAYKTRFQNAHGLPNIRHVTTARDMMLIAREAWKNRQLRKIVGKKYAEISFRSNTPSWTAGNVNELLGVYPGMVGLKTGYTNAAGACLAGAATRDGVTLLSIVMNSEDASVRFTDTACLLDYGFSEARIVKMKKRERITARAWVRGGGTCMVTARPRSEVCFVLRDNETIDKCSYRIEVPRFVRAPRVEGERVGDLVLLYDGKEIGRMDMVAEKTLTEGFSPIAFVMGIYDSILGPLLA